MSARIVRGMPAAEYHALPGYSASLLRAGQRSMLALQHARRRSDAPSPAMALGTLAHMAILEPGRWDTEVIVRPQGLDGRTREGRAWLAEAAASGREPVSDAVARDVDAMALAVREHPAARALLDTAADREVSIIWEADGLPMRSRLDLAMLGDETVHGQWVADVKTTRDASPVAFRRSCESLGYYLQAAVYLDAARAAGCWPERYYVIAVESSAPHDVAVYELSDAALALGRQQYRAVLASVAEAEASGRWRGVSDAILTMEPSPWAHGTNADEFSLDVDGEVVGV